MTRTDEQNANLLVWADALESGEWSQGQERLKTVDVHGTEYCCLGVLCELHDVPFYEDYNGSISYGVRVSEDGDDTGHDSVPRNVLRACGIDAADTLVCIKMNDDEGYTFDSIAKVVRFAVEWSVSLDVAFRRTYPELGPGTEEEYS